MGYSGCIEKLTPEKFLLGDADKIKFVSFPGAMIWEWREYRPVAVIDIPVWTVYLFFFFLKIYLCGGNRF